MSSHPDNLDSRYLRSVGPATKNVAIIRKLAKRIETMKLETIDAKVLFWRDLIVCILEYSIIKEG